jgi:hypothetical protein
MITPELVAVWMAYLCAPDGRIIAAVTSEKASFAARRLLRPEPE